MYVNYINVASRYAVCEERKVSSEQADRMRVELESMDIRLEEERKRSAELLLQVTLIYSLMLHLVTNVYHLFNHINKLNAYLYNR